MIPEGDPARSNIRVNDDDVVVVVVVVAVDDEFQWCKCHRLISDFLIMTP